MTVDAEGRVGDIIAGRYRLLRVLGKGGMGIVYEAVHEFTGQRRAVKVVRPDLAASLKGDVRFRSEVRALAAIGHPGVVTVHDAGQDADGTPYLVLELLEGETLAAMIRRGLVAPHVVTQVALQLLDALAAVHAHGIVHRDIKPENVFLARDPRERGVALRVKLLDFGVARAVARDGDRDGVTTDNIAPGTLPYMSPEQLDRRPVDGRADFWALGAVMFHALVGRPPFASSNPIHLGWAILNEPAPSLGAERPDLEPALVEAVDRALRTDPDERWPSADAMAACLRAAAPARPPAPAATPATPAPSAPSALGGAATETRPLRLPTYRVSLVWPGLAVLAAAATLVALAFFGQDAPAPAPAPPPVVTPPAADAAVAAPPPAYAPPLVVAPPRAPRPAAAARGQPPRAPSPPPVLPPPAPTPSPHPPLAGEPMGADE